MSDRPLPDTLEECHDLIRKIEFWIMDKSWLYIDGKRFTEGYWFYREDDDLFIVTLNFRRGTPVALVSWEEGITLMGTIEEDGLVSTVIDRLPKDMARDRFASTKG